MKNVQKIIDIFGGMDRLATDYICLENEPWQRLVIESIGTGPRGLPMVSVAHYYEQHGDAMRDPEITFEVSSDGSWRPVSFRNDGVGVYQEAVFENEGGAVMIRPRLVKDLAAFARTWNRNIAEQGFVQAAEKAAAGRSQAALK